MRKLFFTIITYATLAVSCFSGLQESLEQRFASVTANEEGLLIVFKKMNVPYRVSVYFDNPTKIRTQGNSNELGEYFIPYDHEWPIRIGHKDSRVHFEPLSSDVSKKGLHIRESNYLHKGRTHEITGTLLYQDSSVADERSFKIVDEKEYIVTSQPIIDGRIQPPITNDIQLGILMTSEKNSVDSKSSISRVPAGTESISNPSNSFNEVALDMVQESSNPKKFILPILGILLLIGAFGFFKFRKK
ncbi:hypothetical protein EGM51_17320 [Verrucomicrobia bacterium S94]|nr:hypothetical protein EGM51_17320 [Verrucomicrobia bacterium S94]